MFNDIWDKSNSINLFSANILKVLILSSRIKGLSLNSFPSILHTLKGSRVSICNKVIALLYRKSIKPNIPEIKEAKSIELFDRRLKFLVEGDSNPIKFYREYYSCLLSYSAMCVPEIADEYYQIDDALRTGYAWNHGPFELWDNCLLYTSDAADD